MRLKLAVAFCSHLHWSPSYYTDCDVAGQIRFHDPLGLVFLAIQTSDATIDTFQKSATSLAKNFR